MRWESIVAIYFLFWIFSVFLVLPFGVRTDEEVGKTPEIGHAESAPHEFSFGRTALRTTVVATLLFGLFYLNYRFGWVTTEMLDWYN